MSFSARLGSTNVHRRRPFDRSRRAPSGPSLTSEDAQPNELLHKERNAGAPPIVRTSAFTPQLRKDSTRGGAKRRHPLSASSSSAGHARWSTRDLQPSGSPSLAGGMSAPSLAENKLPWTSAIPVPSGAGSVNHTPHMGRGTPVHPVPHVDPASLNPQRPSLRTNQKDGHSLPPRQAASFNARGSSSSKSQKRSRKRHKISSTTTATALPPSRSEFSDKPIQSIETTMADALQSCPADSSKVQVVETAMIAPASSCSESDAGASGFLLNDLGMPATQPKRPKRRKVVHIDVPSAPAPTQFRRSSEPGTYYGPNPQSGSPKGSKSPVKRERSPSPALESITRLVREGCVRVAPLPLNCRKTQQGYQAARQQLAKAEMEKLRKLGLQPLRVFTREDGMVIDWYVRCTVAQHSLIFRLCVQEE